MKPKEKAKELIDKFRSAPSYINKTEWYISEQYARQCALICVDEIINDILNPLVYEAESVWFLYWEEVKQEIEKL